jgi:hypothetical protein
MNESRGVVSAGRWERGSQAASPAMLSGEQTVLLHRVTLTEIPAFENPRLHGWQSPLQRFS